MDPLRAIIDRIARLEAREDVSENARVELVEIRLELNDVRRTLELAGVLDEL
jgi:hypothetical protein